MNVFLIVADPGHPGCKLLNGLFVCLVFGMVVWWLEIVANDVMCSEHGAVSSRPS